MKAAQICGNLASDDTDEQYPVVAYCDECFERLMLAGEDSVIVNEVSYEASHGDECHSCEKTVEDERLEQEGS
ncbi:hypothetical protein [Maridesulfovibrio frigidus]|uniref:hypothetical protein n=1 Tax=Maridesulfovibrio frigidus TaxID=340956 RepID=UPI0004E25326|nr:hypothetical protein [Maridesulfovibrio frigidus]